MNDQDIDDFLKHATGAAEDVDPALLDRISKSIRSTIRPVRPLPPVWVMTGVLFLICAVLATAGAAVLGMHGIRQMNAIEIGLIFPVLGVLLWSGAWVLVKEAIPGSLHWVAVWVTPMVISLALCALFLVLFHDFETDHFLTQGIKCLTAGLFQAIPTAVACWWFLRRGFAVNPLTAGLAQGTLAGLAGVCMLELHCVDFETPHLLLWHTAVVPLSGAAGTLLARMQSSAFRGSDSCS